MAGKLFVISAPSGAGKTTLACALIERFGRCFDLKRVITYTSKTARCVEVNGCDYHFLSAEEFETKINEGFFIEWSKAYDAYYGCPCAIIDHIREGSSYILVIDRVGAEQIAKKCDCAVLIWLYTNSVDDLRDRLCARNTDSPECIERRLNRAKEEIALEISNPIYRYHVLNSDFESALERLVTIIKRELYQS
jgi:guanylate kinase